MEKNEVSAHEARFYAYVKQSGGAWRTARELAAGAKVAERTARAYAHKLVELGVLDVAEVFPAHRYRFSGKAGKRNKAYVLRLDHAVEVFT